MSAYCFGQDLKVRPKTQVMAFYPCRGTFLALISFGEIIGSHCSFSPLLKGLINTALFVLEHLDHEKLVEFLVQRCSNYSAMLSASFDCLNPMEAN